MAGFAIEIIAKDKESTKAFTGLWQEYAVFSPPPSNEEGLSFSIQGTYNYIFSEWFPNSGYEFMENEVDFVLCDEHCQAETGKFTEIYIPVVKKE